MPVDLEDQILKILRGMRASDRPATIGDLARELGASGSLIGATARRMVDKGLAEPVMVMNHGTQTLRGLLPQPKLASK